MEGWFRFLNSELVEDMGFDRRAVARPVVFEFLEVFYDRQRRHP